MIVDYVKGFTLIVHKKWVRILSISQKKLRAPFGERNLKKKSQ
jgi:hypothetical protein